MPDKIYQHFHEILEQQPQANLKYGGCVKNKDKDGKDKDKDKNKDKQKEKNKDKQKEKEKDKQKDTNAVGIGTLGSRSSEDDTSSFMVSPEKSVYHVILKDRDQKQVITDDILQEHLEYHDEIAKEGYLDSCGAFASGEKGLLILVCECQEDAVNIVQNDPLVVHGVYNSYDIEEVIESM